MIEIVKAQGFSVGPGFSGTPVWDTRLQGAVGMVIAASRPTDLKAASVLPLDVLVTVRPLIEPLTRQRFFRQPLLINAILSTAQNAVQPRQSAKCRRQ